MPVSLGTSYTLSSCNRMPSIILATVVSPFSSLSYQYFADWYPLFVGVLHVHADLTIASSSIYGCTKYLLWPSSWSQDSESSPPVVRISGKLSMGLRAPALPISYGLGCSTSSGSISSSFSVSKKSSISNYRSMKLGVLPSDGTLMISFSKYYQISKASVSLTAVSSSMSAPDA